MLSYLNLQEILNGNLLKERTNMPPETKLMPCPFCGKEPSITTYYVGCDDCGMDFDAYHQSKEAAIKQWNTRTSPQPTPSPKHCDSCDPAFTTCWNDGSKCCKKSTPSPNWIKGASEEIEMRSASLARAIVSTENLDQSKVETLKFAIRNVVKEILTTHATGLVEDKEKK